MVKGICVEKRACPDEEASPDPVTDLRNEYYLVFISSVFFQGFLWLVPRDQVPHSSLAFTENQSCSRIQLSLCWCSQKVLEHIATLRTVILPHTHAYSVSMCCKLHVKCWHCCAVGPGHMLSSVCTSKEPLFGSTIGQVRWQSPGKWDQKPLQ